MKKAIIYTFSGTGNTLFVAKNIKCELSKFNITTDIVEISMPYCLDYNPNDYDIIGFGYPIHAFNCPKILIEYVKKLKPAKNKYTFVFKTSGEPFRANNASSYLLKNILDNKGLFINQEMHILMPYNIVFRYKKTVVKQMLKYMHAMTKVLAKKISDQEIVKINYRLGPIIMSFIYRIQWPGARLNGRLYYVNKKKCIDCDICIKNCPSKNIYRDKNNTIKFDGNCTMCMRCEMYCPTNAINIGILNLWKVWGRYPFNEIQKDSSIKDNYINKKTFNYFRFFYPFFKKNKKICEQYDVEV